MANPKRVIHEMEQGTPEWFDVRKGIPTASEFAAVMAKPGPRGSVPKTRQTYMRKLAGEIITGEPMESFENAHMIRGREMEQEAVDAYAFETGTDPQKVGFVKMGSITGCSPDRLIGKDGQLEVKTKLPHLLIEILEQNKLPEEFIPQVQGQLWVTGRKWCDFIAFWPKMPTFKVRVCRDEAKIREIERDVKQFNKELAALVKKIKAYGG